ncbi:MAG: SET domain-containing protein [Parcubacteria group bacterium]|jgi:hypothetical protein
MKDYFSWTSPNLELQETQKCGKGVFAKENISQGEKVAIFGGYIMHNDEMLSLPRSINDNCVNVTEEFVLGVRNESELELASFFNHSCDPNAGMKGQIFLVAMRDIKKGEEITFDYAMTLCRSTKAMPYIMHCRCGSVNCRKIITDKDWENADLQEKYEGYFQFYVEEKINKNKNKNYELQSN